MPKFAVIVTTDDAKDIALYGKPYDADGLQIGLEAAFSENGLEVVEIHEVTDELHTSLAIV